MVQTAGVKLLHTSDWHVGKPIRGASRADEHRAVLDEIATVAAAEAVDLVVVAGDLFDTTTPTAESEEIVYRALLALARTGAVVVVIAGNHDNARRLRAVAPFLELGRVHVLTEPTRPADGGVLSLRSAGGVEARVALLPFVSKRGIVRADDLVTGAAFEHAQAYGDRMRLLLEALCAGFGADTVNVLAAHAFVLGAAAGGGERGSHLVEEYAVTAPSFPATIGYGALGHLHRPQRVPTGAPVHYCGSPLQLDFGEGEEPKQVNVVTLEPGSRAEVRAVRLTAGRPLRTVRGTLDELAATSTDGDPWLRVVVAGGARAGLAQTVRELLGDRVVDVRVEHATSTHHRPAVDDHRTRSPIELFDEYLRLRDAEDERVRALFADLLDADHDEVPA